MLKIRPVPAHTRLRRQAMLAFTWSVAAIFSALVGWTAIPAWAQSDPSGIESISIGFDHKIVLGKWVPFTVQLANNDANLKLAIETLDGDAVPIQYVQESDVHLIRIGRAAGVTVRLLDGDGKEQASRRFSLDELRQSHSFLPGTTRLTLYLGLSDKKQQESLQLAGFISDDFAIVNNSSALPASWVGYESIDSLVVAPIAKWDGRASEKQLLAMDEWVRAGGRALLTGGPQFEEYFEGPLAFISPGQSKGTQVISDSGPVELYTNSTEQLVGTGDEGIPVNLVAPETGRKVVSLSDDIPLLVHWLYGFGRVSFVSLDFTQAPLSEWDDRKQLLTLAMDEYGETGAGQQSQTGRVSHIGYTDIAGQLRASMDQFNRVSFVTFTLVALLVGLFILAIGPGDFLFLRKVTGRMEMTWITFSLICLLFSGLAWFLATKLKSSDTELNQVEIVDFDVESGQTRGHIWTHVYSPGTGNYQLSMPLENQLFGKTSSGWFAWQGLPGEGLGSMQSRTDLGLYRQKYQCDVGAEGSNLDAVPMQNASTKTFFGSWIGKWDQSFRSGLRKSATSDALRGEFKNPFDRQLYDVVILYGEWAYQLENRPLEPGEVVVVENHLRERPVAGHFTRLAGRGSDEVNVAWDPASTNLPRIIQMMSFFNVIGGESYTRLTNDFHGKLDLSDQLKMGRAVMIGQIASTTMPLTVNGETFSNYDKRLSLVRIVLPVQHGKKSKASAK